MMAYFSADRLKQPVISLKREVRFYCCVLEHPGTPRRAKVLLGLALRLITQNVMVQCRKIAAMEQYRR